MVIRGGAVDEEATQSLRAQRTPVVGHFHFGPEREGYEAQWTRDAYDRLTAILSGLPIHWRFFAKTEIFRRMKGKAGARGVDEAFAAARLRFPEMPEPAPAFAEAAE